jgi:hypothetical protein
MRILYQLPPTPSTFYLYRVFILTLLDRIKYYKAGRFFDLTFARLAGVPSTYNLEFLKSEKIMNILTRDVILL